MSFLLLILLVVLLLGGGGGWYGYNRGAYSAPAFGGILVMVLVVVLVVYLLQGIFVGPAPIR